MSLTNASLHRALLYWFKKNCYQIIQISPILVKHHIFLQRLELRKQDISVSFAVTRIRNRSFRFALLIRDIFLRLLCSCLPKAKQSPQPMVLSDRKGEKAGQTRLKKLASGIMSWDPRSFFMLSSPQFLGHFQFDNVIVEWRAQSSSGKLKLTSSKVVQPGNQQ